MVAQFGAPAAAARAHEELFLYWASLRRGLKLPARRDLDPAAMKRLLPTLSLIDVLPAPREYRIRLAGTALWDVYGGEITGRALAEVYNSAAADYWRAELGRVVDEGRPAAGVHSLAWRGASHLSMLWVRLPLASDGERVDMILGYDAVIGLGQVMTGVRAA
ncbi:MAG TPA: PAS domain-containing protein [Phenylobacterium sp.]|uniref:motility/cell cycle regulatory protein MopJ n=1 Tax=Phenylobacterium sp. TaxID=1871053 RepID=UPI002C42A138|nr:PAS domain-containing protein [Phenylobacterium sp.]HSV04055.1 PAS domain-containing protein [Phenylobacterium sp.]